MISAGEVIDRMCEAVGVDSDAALARALDIPPSTVGSWRSRGSVPYEECVELHFLRKVSLQWLLTGEGDARPEVFDRTLAKLRLATASYLKLVMEEAKISAADSARLVDLAYSGADEDEQRKAIRSVMQESFRGVGITEVKASYKTDDYVWVPYYDAPLSGGAGAEALDQPPVAWNAYRRSYIEKRGLDAKQLAEFPVRGYSMSPELNQGDTVLVDRRIRDVREGDMYAFRRGKELFVKYLRPIPEGVEVISQDEARNPRFTILSFEFEDGSADIIGRVVRQGRDR